MLDSAPIFVNTYGRGSQSTTWVGPEYLGVAKSHGAKVFGLRLVLTTTTDQVVDGWLLAPASFHDSTTMAAAVEDESLRVLADGAYHSPGTQRILKEKHDIEILALPRKDSLMPWPDQVRYTVNRLRRNIETALGILAVVFTLSVPTLVPCTVLSVASVLVSWLTTFVSSWTNILPTYPHKPEINV